MTDEKQELIIESKQAEAAQAAAVAKEAEQHVLLEQIAVMITESERRKVELLQEQLEAFFRRGISDGRFIPLKDGKVADVDRFTFICDDIANINQILKEDRAERQRFHQEAKEDRHEFRNEIQEKMGGYDVKLQGFVSKDRFSPIEKLVYGAVGLILTTVLLAVVYSVVMTNHPIQ